MSLSIPIEFVLFPLLAILIYSHSLKGPMFFDDVVLQPSVEMLRWRFWETYRPVSVVTHWLIRRWPGTWRGERCLNVWIHAACGLVVSFIYSVHGDPHAALLVGTIYIVHPFAVNTVAYVAGRASMVSTFFGLCGVLAIVTGYSVLSLPFLLLATFAKEDGIAFSILYIYLGAWWLIFPLAFGVWYVLKPIVRSDGSRPGYSLLDEFTRENGDIPMGGDGLPVSLPPGEHTRVVLLHSLLQIPLWAFGLFRSPYHGSGMRRPSDAMSALAVLIALGLVSGATLAPIPMAVLLIGPWACYVFFRTPDQLAEYRNYGMVAGFALLAGLLPWWAILIISVLFALASYQSAKLWTSVINLWKYCTTHGAGDPSRAYQEVGAMIKLIGQSENRPKEEWNNDAQPWLEEALRRSPGLMGAALNLAFVYASQGRHDEGIAVFRRALERTPSYPHGTPVIAELINQKGLWEFHHNRHREARAHFEEALAMVNNTTHQYNLAATLSKMGDPAWEAEMRKLPNGLPIMPHNMIQPQVMGGFAR